MGERRCALGGRLYFVIVDNEEPMSHSLSSLKGGYIKDYRVLGFRVLGFRV